MLGRFILEVNDYEPGNLESPQITVQTRNQGASQSYAIGAGMPVPYPRDMPRFPFAKMLAISVCIFAVSRPTRMLVPRVTVTGRSVSLRNERAVTDAAFIKLYLAKAKDVSV
jgi:hypothetical protein